MRELPTNLAELLNGSPTLRQLAELQQAVLTDDELGDLVGIRMVLGDLVLAYYATRGTGAPAMTTYELLALLAKMVPAASFHRALQAQRKLAAVFLQHGLIGAGVDQAIRRDMVEGLRQAAERAAQLAPVDEDIVDAVFEADTPEQAEEARRRLRNARRRHLRAERRRLRDLKISDAD